MNLDTVPPKDSEGLVHALVEIPQGSANKYEYSPEMGVITLDRVLDVSVRFPTDYGFVPGTEGTDGDPLDIMVMVRTPNYPGILLKTRTIGMLTISHTSGKPEQKLLAVVDGDPAYQQYRDVADVPEYVLREIEHFFQVYKDLEGSDIGTHGWDGADRAKQVLQEAIDKARQRPS